MFGRTSGMRVRMDVSRINGSFTCASLDERRVLIAPCKFVIYLPVMVVLKTVKLISTCECLWKGPFVCERQ